MKLSWLINKWYYVLFPFTEMSFQLSFQKVISEI